MYDFVSKMKSAIFTACDVHRNDDRWPDRTAFRSGLKGLECAQTRLLRRAIVRFDQQPSGGGLDAPLDA